MFCKFCGKEIEDGSTFCPFCGQRLDDEVVEEVKPVQKEKEVKKEVKPEPKKDERVKEEPVKEEPVKVEPVKEEPKKETVKAEKAPISKKQIGIYAGIGAIVIAAIVIVCITVFGKTSIDPFKDMELASYGYDGYGYCDLIPSETAEVLYDDGDYFDEYGFQLIALRNEYKKLQRDASSSKSQDEYFENNAKAQNFRNVVASMQFDYQLEEGKEINSLSNGDTITVSFIYDKDLLDRSGYKFKTVSKTFTVEGLNELQAVDVFKDIELEWEKGYDGYYLDIEDDEDMLVTEDYFEIGEVEDGKVVITVRGEELAFNYGYKPIDGNFSKTFEVGSQPKDINSITDENYDDVAMLAEKVLNEIYIDKCGWNLYVKDNIELITEKHISDLYCNWGTVHAKFDIVTDTGKTYTKDIEFEGMVDSKGKYQYSTDVDKDRLGCTVDRNTWKKY